MPFTFNGFSVENVPTITKWGFEDLGDAPDRHRWRAWWAPSDVTGIVGGIELRAYPVIKVNPASVWINEDGYRQAMRQPWEEGAPGLEWAPFDEKWMKKRLLHNDAGAAWAKPTQEEAIRSLAVRLCRWTARLHSEMKRAESAITALEKLRPDLPAFTATARENLTVGPTPFYVEDW